MTDINSGNNSIERVFDNIIYDGASAAPLQPNKSLEREGEVAHDAVTVDNPHPQESTEDGPTLDRGQQNGKYVYNFRNSSFRSME